VDRLDHHLQPHKAKASWTRLSLRRRPLTEMLASKQPWMHADEELIKQTSMQISMRIRN